MNIREPILLLRYGNMPVGITVLSPPPVVVTNHKQVSAVIESAVQHPNLAEFYTHVSHEFSGVLRDTVYACDIDPAIRGPFDV